MSAEPDKAAGAKKPGSKAKLLVPVLALLVVGGAAGGWFSGLIPKLLGKGEHSEEHSDKRPEGAKAAPIFMDLPDIVANLNTGGRRAAFVKLKAKLELSKAEDEATLTAAMPRVLDLFQGYLREMRPEELRGTAGTYRLREELLARTNLAAPPAQVVAVLFTEMIVQ
jgi:flagellar FliL protein